MKPDPLYEKFIQKWEEVTEMPPQTVGPLTPVYKKTVPLLKIAPWRILIPLAFVVIAGLFLMLQITAAQITSILQRGF